MKYLGLKKRYFLILIYLVCLPSVLLSQIRLKGIVQDNAGKPIPSVNVIAYIVVDADTSIAKYSLTDSEGRFSLLLRIKALYLAKVKALGYEEDIRIISATDSTNTIFHIFRLQPKPIELREVQIKRVIPVKANSDTTTYKVASFADGTERNVEDLLRKLPGVQIAENGKIMVQGKLIDKVTIEGEDLFSKNYQIITKSLAATTLEKVEVLDNYTENPLLKGLDNSRKKVLNLGLRPDLKIRPFGNFTGDIGHKEKYNMGLTAITIAGKLKGGLVGNTNNIGTDYLVAGEDELARNDEEIKDFTATSSNATNNIPYTMREVLPNVENWRIVSNKPKFIGLTLTYKFNKNLKIRAYSYFFNDTRVWSDANNSTYYTDTLNINTYSFNNERASPTLATNHVRIDYLVNAKTNIKYGFTNRLPNLQSYTYRETQNPLFSEQVPTNIGDEIMMNSHFFNAVKRINDKNALVADINFSNTSVNRITQTQSQRYAPYFGLSASFDKAYQDISHYQQELKSTFRWKNKNTIGNLSMGLGYMSKTQKMFSNFSLQAKAQQNEKRTLHTNNILYGNNIALLDVQQSFKLGPFSAFIGGNIQFMEALLENNLTAGSGFHQTKLLFQPMISGSLPLGKHQILSITYFNLNVLPTTEQLTEEYIQTDYRSFQKHRASFFVSANPSLTLSYNSTDWQKLYTFNGSLTMSSSDYYDATNVDFSDALTFTKSYPLQIKRKQISGNWLADKLLATISTKIRWEGSIGQSEGISEVNGNGAVSNTFRYVSTKFYVISVFDGFFNFQVSTKLNIDRVKNLDDSPRQATLFAPAVGIKLTPMPGLSVKVNAEQLNRYILNNHNITNLLDCAITYKKPKSNTLFSLSGKNLLNNTAIYYTEISNFSIYQNIYFLQPRWVLLGVSLAF